MRTAGPIERVASAGTIRDTLQATYLGKVQATFTLGSR